MKIDDFWRLIADARTASNKLAEMPQRLIDILCAMEEQEIVDFELNYVDCLHRAYDARLWLAAVVIMEGCGDDTFTDFRAWLIAQGRTRFEAALVDPDSLADLESFDGDGSYSTLFYFGSVASKAFCKRLTGDDGDINSLTQFQALCHIPKYPPLKNEKLINASDDQAREMFPKLAARFPKRIYTSPFT